MISVKEFLFLTVQTGEDDQKAGWEGYSGSMINWIVNGGPEEIVPRLY